MAELGIVDIREIIRVIKKVHNFDFSSYALTSFKYGLERVIIKNGLLNAESLYRKLSDDESFFEEFLQDIFTPSTEMFRDPSLWRWLREEHFQEIKERHLDNFKIWIPQCISGAELYTLCILLKEIDLLDKVKIIATVYTDISLENIKSGKYQMKKLEVSIENYKRFQGQESFDEYHSIYRNEAVLDTSLIQDVHFIKDDIVFSKAPKNVKLILFRNVMIYYNPSLQSQILHIMYDSLSATGNLIIGLKESIRPANVSTPAFDVVNINEGVYKRKI
jgi:chemotaxis protein methyltransferase CheR